MSSHMTPASDSRASGNPASRDRATDPWHDGVPGGPADAGSPGELGAPTAWALPIITLLGAAAALVAAFIGSGALGGTPIAEAAGGVLSADATPVAPAGSAFSIWSVIYL